MLNVTWKGHLTFGLINIPVGLALATPESSKSSDVSFKTIHKTCLTPTKRKVWCPTCEVELSNDEVGKGWLAQKGEPLVLVDENKLASIEASESRAMSIHSFCPISDIDPVWFDRTYFLVPEDAQQGYVILLEAMKDTGMGALCSFVKTGQEKWGLVRPLQGILGMETLYLAEDIRSSESVVLDYTPSKDELSLAQQIVDTYEGAFDGDVLVSEYRRDLHALLEDTVDVPAAEKVVEDITMEALRATVAELKKAA